MQVSPSPGRWLFLSLERQAISLLLGCVERRELMPWCVLQRHLHEIIKVDVALLPAGRRTPIMVGIPATVCNQVGLFWALVYELHFST